MLSSDERTGRSAGYQLVHKPAPTMRAAVAFDVKFGSSVTENSKALPPAVKKAAEKLHHIENGSFDSSD